MYCRANKYYLNVKDRAFYKKLAHRKKFNLDQILRHCASIYCLKLRLALANKLGKNPLGNHNGCKALLNSYSTLYGKKFLWYKRRSEVSKISRVFLLHQIWIVKYSVKYSTVDCKYLLFLQYFFFRSKPKQYKKCQYS